MISVTAPSNIALIKYMGKIDGTGNKPTNASLSYTLKHLLTDVAITPVAGATEDRWRPLVRAGFGAPALTETGRSKFLNHFRFLKETWQVPGCFEIASANNFPSDCGLASSASSFAALTSAAAQAFGRHESPEELSRLSRQGSGSSCRSFFAPWALWREEGAESMDLGHGDLLHAAVVVSAGMKQVSSSEAHKRVTTSPKFAGRPERAEQRLRELVAAFKENNWSEAYRVSWDEFVDMHELFETSQPGFGYRNRLSENVLEACRNIWNFKKDGPIVTMDAGPNVHLLFRPDQRELADKMVTHFQEKHVVMSSWRGLK